MAPIPSRLCTVPTIYGYYQTLVPSPCHEPPSAAQKEELTVYILLTALLALVLISSYWVGSALAERHTLIRLLNTPSYELFSSLERSGNPAWVPGPKSRYHKITHVDNQITRKRVMIIVENLDHVPEKARKREELQLEGTAEERVRRVLNNGRGVQDNRDNGHTTKDTKNWWSSIKHIVKIIGGLSYITAGTEEEWQGGPDEDEDECVCDDELEDCTCYACNSVPESGPAMSTELSTASYEDISKALRSRNPNKDLFSFPPRTYQHTPGFNAEPSMNFFDEDARRLIIESDNSGDYGHTVGFTPYPW